MHNRRISVAASLGMALVVALGTLVISVGPAPSAGAAGLQETVAVASSSRTGATSVNELQAGSSYLLTVSGSYTYGRLPSGVGSADAECATIPPSPTYQRQPYILLEPSGDRLDLYVNGGNVEWEALNADPFGCSTDHTYQLTFAPTVTGTINFKVHDTGFNDNFGGFTVAIQEIQEVPVESLRLNSATKGVFSTASLSLTKTYRFDITGTYTIGKVGSLTIPGIADAECYSVPPAPGSRDASTVITPTTLDDDVLDVYVNNLNVDWNATIASRLGCNDIDHTYTTLYRPGADGPVKFSVNDKNTSDNAGSFDIKITEVPQATAVPDLALPQISLHEEVKVQSTSKNGTSSALPLKAGDSYLLEARGTYSYGIGQADAECADANSEPGFFLPDRYAAIAPTTDLLDVLVNSTAIEWSPTIPDAEGCNTTDHTYRHQFEATTTSVVNFKMADSYVRDNAGTVTVRIYRIDEIPLGATAVNSSNSSGVNTLPLAAGRTYRLSATGLYTYAFAAGSDADAECARSGTNPLFVQDMVSAPGQDQLDLYVANAPISWKPASGVGFCDPNHEYSHTFTPLNAGQVNLKVKDTGYRDNRGVLSVNTFLKV